MIIDARVRPPFGQFLKTMIPYNLPLVEPLVKRLGFSLPESARQHSVDGMLREMKESGIVKGIIAGRASPLWGAVPNDEIQIFIKKYPETFIGLAGIHPLPIEAATKEVERCINELGFRGITLEPGAANPPMYPNDETLYPVYYICQKLKVAIMMTISGLVGPDIGYAMPTYIDKVAVDFPDLPLIIAHAAYPWVTAMLGVALYRPNVFLLPDVYLPYMPGGEEYVRAANQYMQDQMLFGSAYPLASFSSIIEGYKKMPFEKKVLEKVFYENAARLFNVGH